jgi:hypothetical protein
MSEREEKLAMYGDLITKAAFRDLPNQLEVVNMRLEIASLKKQLAECKPGKLCKCGQPEEEHHMGFCDINSLTNNNTFDPAD